MRSDKIKLYPLICLALLVPVQAELWICKFSASNISLICELIEYWNKDDDLEKTQYFLDDSNSIQSAYSGTASEAEDTTVPSPSPAPE